MEDKKKSVLNKTLILSSNSGYGKSTLINHIFEPICGCVPIEPQRTFESTKINSPYTKIFYLADDNSIKTFYNLMLVINGD